VRANWSGPKLITKPRQRTVESWDEGFDIIRKTWPEALAHGSCGWWFFSDPDDWNKVLAEMWPHRTSRTKWRLVVAAEPVYQ